MLMLDPVVCKRTPFLHSFWLTLPVLKVLHLQCRKLARRALAALQNMEVVCSELPRSSPLSMQIRQESKSLIMLELMFDSEG